MTQSELKIIEAANAMTYTWQEYIGIYYSREAYGPHNVASWEQDMRSAEALMNEAIQDYKKLLQSNNKRTYDY